MLGALIWLTLARTPGPFPLPEKEAAAISRSTTFEVPHDLAWVERYYRGELARDARVTFTRGRDPQGATLTIRTQRQGESWSVAVLHAQGARTRVTVQPSLDFSAETVEGSAPQSPSFVIGRSGHVRDELQAIDASHEPVH